jgi:hypothetical protein
MVQRAQGLPHGSQRWQPAEVKLDEVRLTVAQATLDFRDIPPGFRLLRAIVGPVRSTNGAGLVNMYAQFNGDTAANYERLPMTMPAAGQPSMSGAFGQVSIDCGRIPDDGATVPDWGYVGIEVPFPSEVNVRRQLRFNASIKINESSGLGADAGYGYWRSTEAIARITFLLSAGSFKAGTIASLYGVF